MNFAFPALLVFLLALPGIVFRYNYARGGWTWTSPTSLRRLSDEFAFGLILSIFIHASALSIVAALGFSPDIRAVILFLTGHFGKDDRFLDDSVAAIGDHYVAVSAYFLSVYAFAAVAGYVAHQIVRKCKLDLSHRFFRFDNYWYYMLTGEVALFAENRADNEASETAKPSGVYLSAVVTHGSASYLYRGIVVDWTFDAEGRLDTVAITDARRRDLGQDWRADNGWPEGVDPRYYDIVGDALILRCSEIQTINIDFFWIEIDKERERADSPSSGADQGS